MVSLGTGGAITGFAFVHGTAAQVASPASVPVTLTALDQVAQPPTAQAVPDEPVVRSAIVKVARYYARLAQTKTPAQMEALIWQQDSAEGADHGESCAAFASMTLQLGAQLAGRQSWVTGGSTYPWPLHDWVDARVDPNAASLNITSVLQDAQVHQRWHALGDGYQPQAGDWVLFSGHVEVVTGYSGGVLATIGGDSLPDFSVNAHEYSGSLSSHGVEGFVDNGNLPTATAPATGPAKSASPVAEHQQTSGRAPRQRTSAPATSQADRQAEDALAAIPGTAAAQGATATLGAPSAAAAAAIPGMPSAPAQHNTTGPGSAGQNSAGPGSAGQGSAGPGSAGRGDARAADQPDSQPSASIPGVPSSRAQVTPAATPPAEKTASPAPSYQRHQSSASSAATPGTAAQRAFINEIAPGALAAQRTYGVPAAVTIAQAIDESAWGQSTLASQDHNLFGIKGTGPAGTVMLPTQEVYGGQTVSTTAPFRVYHDVAESIDDHGQLLAHSGSYANAMASRESPNGFANALTGVYATDPSYGTNLIGLMRQYNLYRYDASATSSAAPSASASPKSQPHGAAQSHPASRAQGTTRPAAKATSPSLAAPSTAPSPRAAATSPAAAPAPATSSGPTASPASTTSSPAASSPGASSPGPGGRTTTTAPRSGSVPHPFATPGSSVPTTTNSAPPASPGNLNAAGTGGVATGGSGRGRSLGQAEIPGILGTGAASGAASSSPPSAGHGGTSGSDSTAHPAASSGDSDGGAGSSAEASTSAAVQSSATPVDAELTAVYRPAAAPEPAMTVSYPSASGMGSGSAEHTAAGRTDGRPAHAGQHLASQARTGRAAAAKKAVKRKAPGPKARRAAPRYQPEMPPAVKNALLSSARKPLARAELLYRDVASTAGVSWKILAACDWMQCDAHPRYSPVRGEKLGTVNPDGTVFHTKSEALAQCARDLVMLAGAVYDIDLTVPVPLTVLELANVFAAYRWGGLLRQHNTSAMEFPYSVQGLTDQFVHMRWPKIADPNAPDKPGSRFRRAFGAVPVVFSLDYPAIVL